MSKSECRVADWGQTGFRDGAAGYTRNLVRAHTEACAAANITPDAAAWNAGYDRGNAQYCTPQRAFEEGLRDNVYRGVCSPATEPAFLERFAAGRAIFAARRTLGDIARDIDGVQAELRRRDLKPGDARALGERLRALRFAQRDAEYELARVEAQVLQPPR